MQKFYVSFTWDDWPNGGSYGTTVQATDANAAATLVRHEMADARLLERDDGTVDDILEELSDLWHVVDILPINEFITDHAGQPSSQIHLTEIHKKILQSFSNGDFAELGAKTDLDRTEIPDGLLWMMLREASAEEDCESEAMAIERLYRMREDLDRAIHCLQGF